jgi:hypothetical protein
VTGRSRPRLGRRVLAAVAVLLVAWLVAPAAVPIYDGGPQADEPYRYVDVPNGWSQKGAPTTAKFPVPVRNGLSTAGFANSAEFGPQVSVYVPAGSLQAPAGATTITVTATPSAPTPPLPTDGKVVTNVYTIAATAPGGDVTFVGKGPSQTVTLQMRAPSARQPGPTFEHLVGGHWQRSQTIRVGQDIYQTFAPQLGAWALVQTKTSGGGSGVNVPLLVTGIAVLVLAGIIVGVRVTRSRGAAPATTSRR